MRTVNLTPRAIEDLKEIKSYINFELQNPIAATDTINKIINTYEELQSMPDLGIPVDRYVDFHTDYRFVLANNYSIFYRYDENYIYIVRILYSRMDFVRVLFGK